jgi:hypothetical protein|nr:hypothetical protein [uncultured Acidovorax sp.]
MPPVTASRYLFVRPRGITLWMSQVPDAAQPEQRLLRYLARWPAYTVPVDVKQLSQHTGLTRAQVAQSLFLLHRRRGIGVAATPPSAEPTQAGTAGLPVVRLQAQVRRLCSSSRAAAAVLADPDGLCMASHGLPSGEAEGLAAGVALQAGLCPAVQVLPLYVGNSPRPCRLHCAGVLAVEQEALVHLVQSLHELLPQHAG